MTSWQIFLPRSSHKTRINAILCFGSAVVHHHLKSAKISRHKAAKLQSCAALPSKYLLPRINLHVPILVVASPWLQCVESGPLRKRKVRLSAVPIYPPINSPIDLLAVTSHPSVHPSIWFYLNLFNVSIHLFICYPTVHLCIYPSIQHCVSWRKWLVSSTQPTRKFENPKICPRLPQKNEKLKMFENPLVAAKVWRNKISKTVKLFETVCASPKRENRETPI